MNVFNEGLDESDPRGRPCTVFGLVRATIETYIPRVSREVSVCGRAVGDPQSIARVRLLEDFAEMRRDDIVLLDSERSSACPR